MANEYLKRTPTSTGNRKVFTFALWLKRNIVENDTGTDAVFNAADTSANSHGTDIRFRKDNSGGSNNWNFYDYVSNAFVWRYYGSVEYRDSGNWFHAMFVFDSTNAVAQNRVRVYINGVLDNNYAAALDPSLNYETYVNSLTEHYLGVDQFAGSLTTSYSKSQFSDVFLVDGQALTPDVFGFYKDGDGYISVGSTQATDFRPGQWSPHSPRKIKSDIERRGGFGVNGFYLPMNDSSNPGADFHCAPDTIIKLKGEDLPQPRNGAPTTSDSYVSQLRTQTGGLFNDGVVNFTSTHRNALQDSGNAVNLGTGEFTVEAFVYHSDIPQNSLQYIFMNTSQSNTNTFAFAVENDRIVAGKWAGSFANSTKVEATLPVGSLKTGQWYHYAACRSGNTLRLFIDGKMMVEDTSHTENYNNTSSFGCRVGCEAGAGATVAGYKAIKGFISNVRVVNGTALYTSNFTPPTEPLTAVTNTVLLCCQSPTSPTAAAVSPGTLSVLTEGDGLTAGRNEFDASIVLAVPGITGGQSSGYGDYSADIRGNGSNKTVTANGNATVASISSYYGSALSFDGNASTNFSLSDDNDFDFGSHDFTIEFWRKRNSISDTEALFTKYDSPDSNDDSFWFGCASSGRDGFWWYDSGGTHTILTANNTAVVGQFDHLCAERYGGTVTLYINGVAAGVDYHNINQNNVVPLGSNSFNVKIGANDDAEGTNYYPFDGEIQDLRVYKGVAKYKGSFDVSKPYTPVGIETFRTVADTCKNNFATLNVLGGSTLGTYSNGNLTIANSGSNNIMEYHPTIGMTSGKWYCEVRADEVSSSNHWHFGISSRQLLRGTMNQNGGSPGDVTVTHYADDEYRLVSRDHNNNLTKHSHNTGLANIVNGDIVGVAISITTPVDNWTSGGNFGTVQFYRNGSTYGPSITLPRHQLPDDTGGSAGNKPYTREWFFASHTRGNSDQTVNYGQNPSFSGNVTAGTHTDSNGRGLFKYEPPSGYLALCEDNLPAPAIADPGKHFKTVLWTGNGSSGRGITGVGFQPDLVWVKSRTSTVQHYLVDVIRGVGNSLASNSTAAETSATTQLLSFDDNGFSIGSSGGWNGSGNNYVAWCWKAGGPAVPNTEGSITTQVSVNQTAGFSIATYTTPDGAATTFGHGLGKKPAFAIFKARNNSGNWAVYHQSLGTNTIRLSTTGAEDTSANAFNSTAPTDTLMYLGTWAGTNGSNVNWISYLWAEIEGFSKFGSYTGNGSTDGPFVYCGFKPAFVMLKPTDITDNWLIADNARSSTNINETWLYPNSSSAEGAQNGLDFLSNGFKLRNSNGGRNGNGNTYIFAAFAESPFQTANAK